MKKPKLSVCLITKNEEECIENCLKNLQRVADELIVLDTGSNDKTVEIAPKYAKLFHGKWEDNFSKAKNEANSYAKFDWVLSLSADDLLTEETIKRLPCFLEELYYNKFWEQYGIKNVLDEQNNLIRGVIIKFKMIEFDDSGAIMNKYLRACMFNNWKGIHYIRPIHEVLTGDNIIELDCDFLTIHHIGLQKKRIDMVKKREKYIEIMLKEINKSPDLENNHYYYYHLGRTYSENGVHEKALESYYQAYYFFIRKKNIVNTYSYFTTILAGLVSELIFYKKDYREAMPFIKKMLDIWGELPDALYFMGYCKQKLGYYKEAMSYYMKGLYSLECGKVDWIGICPMALQLPLDLRLGIAKCHMFSGNNNIAFRYLKETELKYPNDLKVITNLFRYFICTGNLPLSVKYYNKIRSVFSESEQKQLEVLFLTKLNSYYKENLMKIINIIDKKFFF